MLKFLKFLHTCWKRMKYLCKIKFCWVLQVVPDFLWGVSKNDFAGPDDFLIQVVRVCVCVCVCMGMCVHACVCACMYACLHVCMAPCALALAWGNAPQKSPLLLLSSSTTTDNQANKPFWSSRYASLVVNVIPSDANFTNSCRLVNGEDQAAVKGHLQQHQHCPPLTGVWQEGCSPSTPVPLAWEGMFILQRLHQLKNSSF